MLGGMLARYARLPETLVLGLPRGGVPVAFEVRRVCSAPRWMFSSSESWACPIGRNLRWVRSRETG